MELLFTFEMENIFRIKIISEKTIWSFYLPSKWKMFLLLKIISGKSIWSFYIRSVLTKFLEGFLFFGKLIWSYYSKPKSMLCGRASRGNANFAETL